VIQPSDTSNVTSFINLFVETMTWQQSKD
jgi:hypothetical protein